MFFQEEKELHEIVSPANKLPRESEEKETLLDGGFFIEHTLPLALLPREFEEIRKVIHSLYEAGHNRTLLASLMNGILCEGKWFFLLSYNKFKDLLLFDSNIINSKDRHLSYAKFIRLMIHAQNSGIIKLDKIVGEEVSPSSPSPHSSHEMAPSLKSEKIGDIRDYDELQKRFLSFTPYSTILIGKLSYKPFLKCIISQVGLDIFTFQKNSLMRYLSRKLNFEPNQVITNQNVKMEKVETAKEEEFTQAAPQIAVESAKLMAQKFGLAPARELKQSKVDYDYSDLEKEVIIEKGRYQSLLETARTEENFRLRYEEEHGMATPEIISRAVLAGIKAGEQRRHLEEVELKYLRRKDKFN